MEISKHDSQKIAILNVGAILQVLLIHSYYLEAESYSFAQTIQLFTGAKGLSSVAVPLFYFISGLLFFRSVSSVQHCLYGIKKRVRTLFVPYIIWNCVFVGWYVFLHYVPGVSQYVNSDILGHLSWEKPLSSLKFLFIEPAGFHLWFLRDLIVYVFVTPLLFYVLQHFPWVSFMVILAAFGGIPRCGITFFVVGGIVSLHYGLDGFSKVISKPVLLVSSILYVSNAVLATLPGCHRWVLNPYFQQVVNLAGIVMVWGIYDIIFDRLTSSVLKHRVLEVSKFTFFVYLFHEPVFNILKKLSLKVLGVSNVSLILLYFINPIIMAAISVCVALVLKRMMPKVYSVFVGGR